MVRIAIWTLMLLASTASDAQVRKCQGPDGKVSYSDAVCPSTTTSSEVNTSANTLPSDFARQKAQHAADAGKCKPDPTPINPNVQQCKFAYHVLADEKGKALAADAKRECLDNMALERACRGSEKSMAAYNVWRDHHAIKSQQRSAIASKPAPQQGMTCRPDGLGALRCN